jgi:hypothetical protein
MVRGESVVTYLTKFTQIRDELAVVGETVDETELVRIALNGFTKQWDVFVRGVVAREKLPDWERLWDDLTEEELRVGTSQASQPKSEDEENLALAGKGKFRGKKGPSGGQTSKGEKKNISARLSVLPVTNQATLPINAQTRKRAARSHTWLHQLQLKLMSLQLGSRMSFHSLHVSPVQPVQVCGT